MLTKIFRRYLTLTDLRSKAIHQYNYEDYIYERSKKKPEGAHKKDLIVKEKKLDFPLPQHKIDLKNNFLYGFKKEDFANSNPIVQRAFSLQQASPKQLRQFKIKRQMEKYGIDKDDSSSVLTKCILMSEKIHQMIDHIQKNKKDVNAQVAFKNLTQKRKQLLTKLRLFQPLHYITIVKEYGINYNPNIIDKFKPLKMGSQTIVGAHKRKRNYDKKKMVKQVKYLKRDLENMRFV